MVKDKKNTNEADVIWNEIKDKEISMFSLPNQKISDHIEKLEIPGKSLFVKLKSAAALVGLEKVLGPNYSFEQSEKGHVIITKVKQVL